MPRVPLLLVPALALAACADLPATALLTAIASDSATRTEAPFVRVRVYRGDALKHDEVYASSIFATPASLTLRDLTDGDSHEPVRVVVEGFAQDPRATPALASRIRRSARLSFVKEKTKLLRLGLAQACLDVPCTEEKSCQKGICQPEQIDNPDDLPDAPGEPTEALDPARFGDLAGSGGSAGAAGQGGAGAGGSAGQGGDSGQGGAGGAGSAGASGQSGGGQGGAGQGGLSGSSGQSGAGQGGDAGSGGAGAAGEAGAGGAAQAGDSGAGGQGGSGAGGGSGQGGAGASGEGGASGVGGQGGDSGQGGAGQAGAGGQSGAGGSDPVVDPDLPRITAGSTHACAIHTGGLYCWGDDSVGQVDGTLTPGAPLTPALFSLANVAQVRGSFSTMSVALTNDGALWHWGGAGPSFGAPSAALYKLSSANLAVQVATGINHLCYRTPLGLAECIGANSVNQLGDGTKKSSQTPVQVQGPTSIQQLAGWGNTTCARTSSAAVWCWGEGYTDGSTTLPVKIEGVVASEIAVGVDRACAVVAGSGDVVCWSSTLTPTPVKGLSGALHLALGDEHICASLKATGGVLCQGANNAGQLGSGHSVFVPPTMFDPEAVVDLPPGNAQELSAGSNYTCVRMDNDEVYCWGLNNTGQFGNGQPQRQSFFQKLSLASVAKVSSAPQSQCAIDGAGVLTCWGRNDRQQLGAGPEVLAAPTDAQLASQRVAVGETFACAEPLAGGEIRCRGNNQSGQLGTGANGAPSAAWQPVINLGSAGNPTITDLAAGANHACATVTSGQVRCWGAGTLGQLGNGSQVSSATPVIVSSLSGAKQLALCKDTSCALKSDNTVACWGSNGEGQFGLLSPPSAAAPMDVPSVGQTFDKIGCYGTIFCAHTPAQDIYCWGGKTLFSPQKISAASGASSWAVAGNPNDSNNSALYYQQGTTVFFWDGFSSMKLVDASAGALVGGGQSHLCIMQGGNLGCLGDNSYGQLGLGSKAIEPRAVKVPLP